jgi:hypothetical protein
MPMIIGQQWGAENGVSAFSDGEMTIPALAGESVESCTIKDVARLAQVSTATVSRVANGADNVSPKTRAKVLSVISRLRYRPNATATELARANGGISRKHEVYSLTSANPVTNMHSHPGIKTHNKFWKTERLRSLVNENARLRQVVIDLTIDLERWKSIAQNADRL